MAPTSSDVVAYEGIMKSETAVRFLDCEGEGGRVAPEELVDRMGLWSSKMVREQRSVAVEKYLPRMAYVCSEIVVFITRDDLSDTRCMDEVVRFALDQTNNAHSVKPCLVIISNRSEYASKTIEETTKQFFEVHDPEYELLNYYKEIKVQRLPLQERSPKEFQSRLDELLNTMDQMLMNKIPERKQLGIYFNEYLWLLVFNILITEHFDRDTPIHMGEVVQKATIPKEDFLCYQVFRFFITSSKFLEEVGSELVESFYLARSLAVEMLAALHAADLYEWAEEIGSVVVKSPVQMKNRLKAALKDFQKLIECVDGYAPCMAVKEKKGTLIHCTNRKGEHELGHCNPKVELYEKEILAAGVGSLFKAVNRVKKKLNRMKHKTFPARWEGPFQFDDSISPVELQELFMSTMQKLENKSRTVHAVARVGIVRKALPVSDIGSSVPELLRRLVSDPALSECIVCLSTHKRRDNRVGTRQLFPCGHTFCEVCISPFRSAEGVDQVSVLSGETTLCGVCPLCHSMVSQLSDIA